ncbi:MAG: sigma-70 family RNA polymerase sigma factor [Gammaproteobacteria bacterium]|jgi:RNA polymerase sigma-70 factor (ECF subfamily)
MLDSNGTIANNNTKAWFSEQIEANMGSLYKVAMRLTRNSTDAEDLVAESVEKAWTSIDKLDDRNRFRPWIFRIMHNRYISSYRKKSVRPDECQYDELDPDNSNHEIASLLIEQPNEFLNWWATPEQELINNMLGDDLIRAVESLPEMFQLTVVLINIEGFSYDEAAEALGVSPGTIRSRMNRGRTLLQKALWQHANDAGLITDEMMMECKQ